MSTGLSVQERLQDVWRTTFALTATPGPEADIFDASGGSLRIVQLAAAIYDEFGIDLRFTSIYEARSLAELAAVIASELQPSQPPG